MRCPLCGAEFEWSGAIVLRGDIWHMYECADCDALLWIPGGRAPARWRRRDRREKVRMELSKEGEKEGEGDGAAG
jgi:hypothetical protein